MDQDADRKRHEARKTLSQNILQKAREEASKKAKYDSVKMRADLCKLFSERESRFSPREWQLDVAEALLLGIDTGNCRNWFRENNSVHVAACIEPRKDGPDHLTPQSIAT